MTDSSRKSDNDRKEIASKLKVLNILRPVIVTFLLGSNMLFSILPKTTNIFALIVIGSFALSIIYTALLRKINNIVHLVYLELILDLLLETGVVFCTGGTESSFQLCYALTVIAAGVFLYKRCAYTIATTASILYIGLTTLQIYSIIKPLPNIPYPESISNIYFITFKIFINVTAFYIIAYLSSYLATSFSVSKKELIKKKEDFTRLQTFNSNILENMSSGLVVTNMNMKVILTNRGASLITGFSGSEFRDKNFTAFFESVPIHDIVRTLNTRNRDSYRWEGNITCKNKDSIYVGMTISPLKNDKSEKMGTISTFQDLTQLKKMEHEVKRSEKLAAIGRLSAGMAHEIRNPLASIRGSVQMLRDELELKEPDKKLMNIILEESDRLNKIITDFLVFARPKPLNMALSNIKQSIEDTVSLVGASPNTNKKISIESLVEKDIPRFMFDADQIKQVLWNLIVNSIQAMPDGGIIKIAAELILEQSMRDTNIIIPDIKALTLPLLKFSIRDQGEHIAEEDMSKIFDPFYTTKEGGSGLGLSIVHRIIEDHRGQLSVENNTDSGTTFTFYLPLEIEV